jgi:hypothetical protein
MQLSSNDFGYRIRPVYDHSQGYHLKHYQSVAQLF